MIIIIKKVIAVELTYDEEKEIIKSFFEKSWKVCPNAITDPKVGCHELINDELGIERQEGIIHVGNHLTVK